MDDLPIKNANVDLNHIILDIGLSFTKCGFLKDTMPSHILPTPLELV